MPRGQRANIDLSWLFDTGGTPEKNPAAGATKPGDVDYTYKGDPEEAIKKFGTGPVKSPGYWSRATNPRLASSADAINTRALAAPIEAEQAYNIQHGIASRGIEAGLKLAGREPDPDLVKTTATSIVGGYPVGKVGQDIETKTYIAHQGPVFRGQTTAKQSEYAKNQIERGLGRQNMEETAKDYAAVNTLQQAGVNTPLEQELGQKLTAAEIARLPISTPLKTKILQNAIVQADIEAAKQGPEKAMAERSNQLSGLQADTLAKRLGVENIEASHLGSLAPNPVMMNVNPTAAGNNFTVSPSSNPLWPGMQQNMMAKFAPGATNTISANIPGVGNIPGLPAKPPSISTGPVSGPPMTAGGGAINPTAVNSMVSAMRGLPQPGGVATPPVSQPPSIDPRILQTIQQLLQSGALRGGY